MGFGEQLSLADIHTDAQISRRMREAHDLEMFKRREVAFLEERQLLQQEALRLAQERTKKKIYESLAWVALSQELGLGSFL